MKPEHNVSTPAIDFSVFGDVERRALDRIQQVTAGYLMQSWTRIPHVTHHDEVDVTELDAHRASLTVSSGTKLTPLAYFVKACIGALKVFPHFNASLEPDGKTLVLKKYFNIGIAIDTPRGLVVGVVRDCDRKDLPTMAGDIADLSRRASEKGLPMTDMIGGCFSLSSLGGIGGTGFTPIINAPEVAILGISRVVEKPAKDAGGNIIWRKMVPLSLSYDHRVINGADAARFVNEIKAGIATLIKS